MDSRPSLAYEDPEDVPTSAHLWEGSVGGRGAGSFPKQSGAHGGHAAAKAGTAGGKEGAGTLQRSPTWLSPGWRFKSRARLNRETGEGSSPFPERPHAAEFPVSPFVTLCLDTGGPDIVVLGSFHVFRCPSFVSSTRPGWAFEGAGA